MMTIDESQAWRPELSGTSWDILPFYRELAPKLPIGARCVEIGVAAGRSTLFLASELVCLGNVSARIYAVDPWEPDGLWPAANWGKFASKEELELVCALRVESHVAARLFSRRTLDLVFVDGDHSYGGCALDIASYMPLVKHGGIIAGHDYGDFEQRTFGGPTYPGVDRAVHELIGKDLVTIHGSVWEYKVP